MTVAIINNKGFKSANDLVAHIVYMLKEIAELRAELEAKEISLYKHVLVHRRLIKELN